MPNNMNRPGTWAHPCDSQQEYRQSSAVDHGLFLPFITISFCPNLLARARASASLQFGLLPGFSFNVAMKHFGL